MQSEISRIERSDARNNRERLLRAARTLFSRDGFDVPVREVARRADVGLATLYRHFPTKEALVTAAFARYLRACQDIVDTAIEDHDPWHALCQMIEQLCELHASDGVTEALLSAYPQASKREAIPPMLRAIEDVVERAKESGHLRADIVLDDLVVLLMASKGIRTGSRDMQIAASRRYSALVIQALSAGPHNQTLPPPPHVAPLTRQAR